MPLKFKRGAVISQAIVARRTVHHHPYISQTRSSACGNDFIGAADEHGTLVTLVIFACSNDVARVAD